MSPRPDAASRLRRLLTLIPWVVDHQGASIDDIAARFGISVSELERDLELIPFCGLPPYSPDRLIDCQVVDGKVYLRFAEYFRRPVSLTPSEGFTLLAAGRALLAVPGADVGGSLASALGKLADVLGGADGMAVELGEGRYLEDLRRAAAGHEQVEIEYYAFGRDAHTRRRIDPLAVFAAEGQWYVDAYCHRAEDDRLFRVDRVATLTFTGETFEPTDRPGATLGVFSPAPSDPRAVLLLHPDAAWVVEAYPTESVGEEDDGRLRVTLAVGGPAWLERLLLRLGPAAELVAPPEMVALGAEAARRVMARYAVGTSGHS